MGRLISALGRILGIAALLMAAACGGGDAPAAKRSKFSIGWSIYAGWMPWPYAQQSGIVKKWADKYGLKISIVQVNDYAESVNQFTAGKLDGVTVANMDALTIPAAAGKDSSAIIIGDYSNGNDGLVAKGAASVAALKGKPINLVELSVSHYLLARALERAGMALPDVRTINTADADIVAAFASADVEAAVAWNPQLAAITAQPGARLLFSSADVPGEIIDLLVVDTATLKANPDLGKALAGIWYETMALIVRQDEQGKAARAAMAKLAGATPAEFDAQLATTYLYADPAAAAAAARSPDLITTMTRVRDFSFARGLFKGAATAGAVGMGFPGGRTLGDPARIMLRFDDRYMQLAADGGL